MAAGSDLSYYQTQGSTKYNEILSPYSSLITRLLENGPLLVTERTYRLVM